jgi:hypothetical protein
MENPTPEPNSPDALSWKAFVITIAAAAAFVVVVYIFVL